MEELDALNARIPYLLERHHLLRLAIEQCTAPNLERARQAFEILDRQLEKAFDRWDLLSGHGDPQAERRRELGINPHSTIRVSDLLPDAIAEIAGKILDDHE